MAEDQNTEQFGEPVDDDVEEVRRPQHLKRNDPRAAEIEGPQKFRVNEEERLADADTAVATRARKRSRR